MHGITYIIGYKCEIKTKAMILKSKFLSTFHTWLHVSNWKSADMRIDIVKYEEGFFIVVKILKKGVSNPNVAVKVGSKTIVKITVEQKV